MGWSGLEPYLAPSSWQPICQSRRGATFPGQLPHRCRPSFPGHPLGLHLNQFQPSLLLTYSLHALYWASYSHARPSNSKPTLDIEVTALQSGKWPEYRLNPAPYGHGLKIAVLHDSRIFYDYTAVPGELDSRYAVPEVWLVPIHVKYIQLDVFNLFPLCANHLLEVHMNLLVVAMPPKELPTPLLVNVGVNVGLKRSIDGCRVP